MQNPSEFVDAQLNNLGPYGPQIKRLITNIRKGCGDAPKIQEQTAVDSAMLANRKPGKTPPKSWPPLPNNLAGKKPNWNSEGYWEGAKGNHTWDDRSHGSGVDRGNGSQDGHWDDEKSNNRWNKNGELLPITSGSQSSMYDRIGQITGLSGEALLVYIAVSEASRLIPARNLIPAP